MDKLCSVFNIPDIFYDLLLLPVLTSKYKFATQNESNKIENYDFLGNHY